MRDDKNKELSAIHQLRNDLSWDDIRWIKKNTFLKIILKGVMSPEDIPMA
jgi:isopentenyl diphosphate isomerase/L-lactate dehydrogenase-like FMN-dependent dehydrogenase